MSFMDRCRSLTSIDLSGLTKLENIGSRFMEGCKSLTSIKCSLKVKNMIKDKIGNVTNQTAGKDHLLDALKYVVLQFVDKPKSKITIV